MVEVFDPYFKWLGIHPKDQPPHYYRLLGVELFESDVEVIEAAADRHVAYLQDVATGRHVRASQKLLNEIAAARLCLLDQEKKAAYDAELRADLAAKSRGSAAPGAAPPVTEPSKTPPPFAKPPAAAKPARPPAPPPVSETVRRNAPPPAPPKPDELPSAETLWSSAREDAVVAVGDLPRTAADRFRQRHHGGSIQKTPKPWLAVGAGCAALAAAGLVLLIVVFAGNNNRQPDEHPGHSRQGDEQELVAAPEDRGKSGNGEPVALSDSQGGIETQWNLEHAAPSSTASKELVAHYTFDHSDRPGKDETGQHHADLADATLQEDAQRNGRVLALDGMNDRFDIPRPVQDDFTIALWIKTRQEGERGAYWHMGVGIVDGDVEGPAHDFGLSLVSGKVALGVGTKGNTVRSSQKINDDRWHHVAVTRNANTGELQLYVDGHFESSREAPKGRKDAASHLVIGCSRTAPRFFQGCLDDLRFYDYVLSERQVRDLTSVPLVPKLRLGNEIETPHDHGFSHSVMSWVATSLNALRGSVSRVQS